MFYGVLGLNTSRSPAALTVNFVANLHSSVVASLKPGDPFTLLEAIFHLYHTEQAITM